MTKTKIPKTIEEAVTALDGLGRLLTAKEWERAAIIYAFTDPVTGNQAARTGGLSIEGFAARGITGLKSHTTIREYRKAWQWAIDNGMAVEVKPGDSIELPNHGWPPSPRQHSSTKDEVITGMRKLIDEDPKGAIEELIQDSPETMPKLAKGVRTAHPGLAAMAATPDREEEGDRIITHGVFSAPDYSKDLRYAANAIQRLLVGLRNGWEPDAMEKTLIAFLAMAFNDLNTGDSTSNVIDEIEQFLQKEMRA